MGHLRRAKEQCCSLYRQFIYHTNWLLLFVQFILYLEHQSLRYEIQYRLYSLLSYEHFYIFH
jgi:hypothetical protein